MLDKDLIPTPLLTRSEKKTLRKVVPKPPRFRMLFIFFYMLLWLCDMLVLRLTFNWNSRAKGEVTKKFMERLGFLWVKIGQILSLRKDFFGKEFCDVLATLQHRANGFSTEIVVQQIERSLNRSIQDVFSHFDEKPLAAASIAQVHRAQLRREDAAVVVKIMRPHAKEYFDKDIRFLRWCVAVLKRLDLWSFMRWDEAIWEIEHMMKEEIDYRYEASNLKIYKKIVKSHKVYVPTVFKKYSAQNVLVMEFIPGVLLSDFNNTQRIDPGRVDQWCMENNFDGKRAGRNILLSFSRQLFEDNFYHADLHPGNIILLKNSRMALIDIGSVGTVELDLLRRFFSTIKSLATKDYHKTADLMISFCPTLPMDDLSNLNEELVRCMRDWEVKTPLKELDYYDRSVTSLILEMVELMTIQYELSIGWGFLKITRSWFNLESSLDCMMPESNNLKLFSIYFAERENRVIHAMLQPKNIRSQIVAIPDTLNEYRLFIEPRIRRAGRTIEIELKRSDQMIMAIAKSFCHILLTSGTLLLLLTLALLSQAFGSMHGLLTAIFPENFIGYFADAANAWVTHVETTVQVHLPPHYRWLWTGVPFGVNFRIWMNARDFSGRNDRQGVQLDSVPYS